MPNLVKLKVDIWFFDEPSAMGVMGRSLLDTDGAPLLDYNKKGEPIIELDQDWEEYVWEAERFGDGQPKYTRDGLRQLFQLAESRGVKLEGDIRTPLEVDEKIALERAICEDLEKKYAAGTLEWRKREEDNSQRFTQAQRRIMFG